MLNQSSQNDFHSNQYESDDLLFHKKSFRKSKIIKKKFHEKEPIQNQKKRCPDFDNGLCAYGAMCNFSHSFIPDIAKKQCKNFATNSCHKGEFCPFSHNLFRFPCKELNIYGSCNKNKSCPFSHQQIDSQMLEEFYEDNIDFICQAVQKGLKLSTMCLKFTQSRDLSKNTKKNSEFQDLYRFPFFYGIGVTKSSSAKGSNQQNEPKQQILVKNQSKKQIKNLQPFSIRLKTINRTPIPEKIFQPLNANMMVLHNLEEQQWLQKDYDENLENVIMDKISPEMNFLRGEREYSMDIGSQNQFESNSSKF